MKSRAKYLAIICELNPLHNGHAHLFQRARADFPDHKIVAIMSGQFTQRGEIALLDKYTRAKHAILAGADIVLELPAAYALSSAENFALGGVKLANSLRGAEYLYFASESGDIDILKTFATIIVQNGDEISEMLKKKSKSGDAYANLYSACVLEVGKNKGILDEKIISEKTAIKIFSEPNNILAVQYIAALYKTNSTIKPVTITRIGEGYNSANTDGQYSSASGIRASLLGGNFEKIHSVLCRNVPEYVKTDIISAKNSKAAENSNNLLDNSAQNLCFQKMLSDAIFSAILTKNASQLSEICGISEGLENRILAASKESYSLENLLAKIKTKRYTRGRISRILLCALLDVNKKDYEKMVSVFPYANILAIKKGSLSSLDDLKVPFLTKYTDREKLRKYHSSMLSLDDKANALYCHYANITIKYNFIIL